MSDEENEQSKKTKGGYRTAYPAEAPFSLRSHRDVVLMSTKSLPKAECSAVYKAPSPLLLLKYFDIVRQTDLDSMHIVWHGVVEDVMYLWFSAEHSSKPYSLRKFIVAIDSKFQQIRFPHDFSHAPRSFKDHSSYWKGW